MPFKSSFLYPTTAHLAEQPQEQITFNGPQNPLNLRAIDASTALHTGSCRAASQSMALHQPCTKMIFYSSCRAETKRRERQPVGSLSTMFLNVMDIFTAGMEVGNAIWDSPKSVIPVDGCTVQYCSSSIFSRSSCLQKRRVSSLRPHIYKYMYERVSQCGYKTYS